MKRSLSVKGLSSKTSFFSRGKFFTIFSRDFWGNLQNGRKTWLSGFNHLPSLHFRLLEPALYVVATTTRLLSVVPAELLCWVDTLLHKAMQISSYAKPFFCCAPQPFLWQWRKSSYMINLQSGRKTLKRQKMSSFPSHSFFYLPWTSFSINWWWC